MTGRGHKGLVQKTAERLGVDQAAVRKRAQKVAEVTGETVDIERDPPAELTRKAEKFKESAKPARRARWPEAPAVARRLPDLLEALRGVEAAWPPRFDMAAYEAALANNHGESRVNDLRRLLKLLADRAGLALLAAETDAAGSGDGHTIDTPEPAPARRKAGRPKLPRCTGCAKPICSRDRHGVGAGRCLWARAGGRVAADAWSPPLAAR